MSRAKPRRIEAPIQRAIREALYLQFKSVPGFRCFHIANGGKRDAITAAIMKGDGVEAGVADLCVMGLGWGVGFLEVKAALGRVTPEQYRFNLACLAADVHYEIVYDHEQAIKAVRAWIRSGR